MLNSTVKAQGTPAGYAPSTLDGAAPVEGSDPDRQPRPHPRLAGLFTGGRVRRDPRTPSTARHDTAASGRKRASRNTSAASAETPTVTGNIASGKSTSKTERVGAIDPAMKALLDHHAPGWNFDSALIVLAHPDDETMMVKTICTLLAMGVKVHVVYVTQSNGGTAFTSETGIQRPKFAATGKEALYSEQYGTTRIYQSFGFLKDLCPDSDLLKIDVLSYPDRSPYNAPAERSIRYSDVADWNRDQIVEFIARIIADEKPAVAFSLRSECAVHVAHAESATLLDEAIDAIKQSGDEDAHEPVRISAIEAGWYEQRYLRETPDERAIVSEYSDEDRLAIRAMLAKWFGERPPHVTPNDFEQPPGKKAQWNAELSFEALEAAAGSDPRVVAFFRALLNEPLPVSVAQMLAPKLEVESGATEESENVTVHDPQIPEHTSPSRKRTEGIEVMPAAVFTSHIGPQQESEMRALPERVRLARAGHGAQPHDMTDKEHEGLAAFQAPPPYVSNHVSLGTRIRALKPHERREGHRFIAGPRRDSVLYVLSTEHMPADVLGNGDSSLTLDVHTRPFASLESARERAIQLLKSKPDADVAIYRIDGPARELHAALKQQSIHRELVTRAAMVLDEKGNLHQTTIANTRAKYGVEPGEEYGAPPVTGMPQRKIRQAGALALGKIVATAAGTYAGLRYGLDLPPDTTAELMLQSGRAMFGARALINGTKRVVQIRVMQRLDEVAADREQLLSPDAPLAAEIEGALPTLQRAEMPALDTLERRTTGMRGILRGYRRHDRDEFAMLAETLRITPEDVDAYRRLDTVASDGLFASESTIERARRVFWGASYAPSDIAAASIWLAPEVMLTGFGSVEGTAIWLSNLATLMFVPVHLSGNAGQRLGRSLEVIGDKHNLDPTVPAAGDKLRRFLPGNDHLPPWMQKALGDLLIYKMKRPDGGRMYKPPFFKRLPEFQMAGATIASVPFMAANALGAVHSVMTGDIAAASLQAGMVAADGVFLRGFQLAHQNAHGENHGRGPIVRRGPIAAIRPPQRGAEASPVDITQPHLVENGGLLRKIDPEIVIGVGMATQVGLGFMLM